MSRRRRRPLRSQLRAALRWLLAFLFTNVGVVLLVLGYTIAGAFVFQAIEGAEEVERALGMARARNATALYLWTNVTLPLNTLNDTEFKYRVNVELLRYQQKIVWARRRGWEGGSGSSGDLRRWNFSSAFLYCLTVITTIGYGHLSPRTSWGKLTTILYALLGMPLFLLYLSNVGELFASWFKWLYALVCLCRGCPGFHRRRVAKLRAQITDELGELSEVESVEALEPESARNVVDSFRGYNPSTFEIQSRLRKPNYLRTLSEPQSRQHARDEDTYSRRRPGYRQYWTDDLRCGDDYVTHNQRLTRGQSLPADYGYDKESSTPSTSDFTYVTFDAQTITVPISVCVSILVGYIIFGSMLFGMWEKWDQLDGAYFCFISLSSIGFGDFVPGERVYTPTIETSFIVCSLYLMLGMALVAMCFNLMQEQVIHYYAGVKRALRRICRCPR